MSKSQSKSIAGGIRKKSKNSKVFEQKGDLLNFKANIDPWAVLSQAEAS